MNEGNIDDMSSISSSSSITPTVISSSSSSSSSMSTSKATSSNEVFNYKRIWTVVEISLYGLHLYLLYIWLIPTIGGSIYKKCTSSMHCNYRLTRSNIIASSSSFMKSFDSYRIDLSDGQWREFRNSLTLLVSVMIGSSLLHYLIRKYCSNEIGTYYRLIFGMIFIWVQHGYHTILVILLALIGYFLPKLMSKYHIGSQATWFYGCLVLMFKESYRIKYQWKMLIPLFDSKYSGMYGWQLAANFLVLRMISFGLDYNWAYQLAQLHQPTERNAKPDSDSTSIIDDDQGSLSRYPIAKEYRVDNAQLEMVDYNLTNYLSYIFYAPLYIGGPILCFNEYILQAKSTHRIPAGSWLYCVRFVLCYLLMEYLLTKFPFFAVTNSGLFSSLTASELAVVFYGTLKLMWLKFLLLWRFFRMWSLFEGFEAPENMKRCMSNNCSLEQFWRGWHSSFNQWLIKYLYTPIGGRQSKHLSVTLVFFFVAMWHDAEMKLLIWGLLNSVFFFVEIVGQRITRTSSYQQLPLVLCNSIQTLCSAFYIIVLISVNLIGYSVGVGGLSSVLAKFMTPEGFKVIVICFYFLCWGVRFMSFLEDHSTLKVDNIKSN